MKTIKNNNLATKEDIKELAKFEHRMNDHLDKVITEISESREDRALLSNRVYEHDEQLEKQIAAA